MNFFYSDPVVTSLAQDIFKVLAQTPHVLPRLEARLIPTLVSILAAAPGVQAAGGLPVSPPQSPDVPQVDKSVASGLPPVALDVLQTVVRAAALSPAKSPQEPLSELLLCSAFPAAVQCTLHSDDNAILQVFYFELF